MGPALKVNVKIPTDPSWAHDAAVEAMEIWNRAQEWFVKEYFPNEQRIYTLQEAQKSEPYRIMVTYENQTNSDYSGLTSYYQSYVEIKIVLISREGYHCSRSGVVCIATHEFGHALGLDDIKLPTSNLNLTRDLMNGTIRCPKLPSTLDLYGVYVLTSGRQFQSVTLPSNIPYEVVPESAVPEFPYISVVLMITTFVCVALLRRRGSRLLRQATEPAD